MIEIPKGDWRIKGTWHRVVSEGKPKAILECPKCGKSASLDHHEISQDGSVLPSVVCTEEGCDFHEFIKLKNWHKCCHY